MKDDLKAIYHDLRLDSPVVRWAIALPILYALAVRLGWLPAGEWHMLSPELTKNVSSYGSLVISYS